MTGEALLLVLSGVAMIVVASAVVWRVVRTGIGWQAWLLYCIARVYAPLMFGWRPEGRCPFPAEGPAIIIANHRSPVDPMMVWVNHHWGTGRIRVINFMTAREYCEIPGLAWLCRHMRCIPVDRNGRDMGPVREALKRLSAGELVGVFPEGKINTGEGLLPGDTGMAYLALRANVPVHPVFIHGAPQGNTMVEPFYTRSRVRVTYGEPIDLSGYADRKKSQELLREVSDLLMSKLAELGGTTHQPTAIVNAPAETVPMRQETA